MLVGMIEIDTIHTFEDEGFLKSTAHASWAVALVGAVAAAVLASAPGFYDGTPETAFFEGITDGWGAVASTLAFVGALLAGTVACLFVHELVHGVFFKALAPRGSRVTFGARLDMGMFYACADGIVFTRRAYLAAVLAPTFVVTMLCAVAAVAVGWPALASFAGVLHLAGCTGDWCYAARILRDRRILACEDTSWGVRFLGRDDAA